MRRTDGIGMVWVQAWRRRSGGDVCGVRHDVVNRALDVVVAGRVHANGVRHGGVRKFSNKRFKLRSVIRNDFADCHVPKRVGEERDGGRPDDLHVGGLVHLAERRRHLARHTGRFEGSRELTAVLAEDDGREAATGRELLPVR